MGVQLKTYTRAVPLSDAIEFGVTGPAVATREVGKQIVAMFQRRVPVQLVGPVGIVRETAQQAKNGWRTATEWVGIVSLQLFIGNLLPIPALDGGRLVLLGYEMTTRRRPNPAIEAKVLTVSMMLMIGLFLVVTAKEIWQGILGLFGG
jgi:regulator of sigma E protease